MPEELMHHPESHSYFIGDPDTLGDSADAQLCVVVTGIPSHVARASEQGIVLPPKIEIENDVPINETIQPVHIPAQLHPNTKIAEKAAATEIAAKPAKKPRAPAKPKTDHPLLAALKFLTPAQKKTGTRAEQHCMLNHGWAVASNSVLTIGVPITESLSTFANTFQLIDALKKAGAKPTITQRSDGTVTVSSTKFEGVAAHCEPFDIAMYDQSIAPLTPMFADALSAVAGMPDEKDTSAYKAGVWLLDRTVVGTNGYGLLQAFHGASMPPITIIPKQAASAIAKCGKAPVSFGLSPSSITFWFADGSFIKTQIFSDNKLPSVERHFEAGVNPVWTVPDEFFAAVKAIATFSKNGIVYIDDGVVWSHETTTEVSNYTIENFPYKGVPFAFNAKFVGMCSHVMERMQFVDAAEGPKLVFSKGNMRGALMGVNWKQATDEQVKSPNAGTTADYDDDIPF